MTLFFLLWLSHHYSPKRNILFTICSSGLHFQPSLVTSYLSFSIIIQMYVYPFTIILHRLNHINPNLKYFSFSCNFHWIFMYFFTFFRTLQTWGGSHYTNFSVIDLKTDNNAKILEKPRKPMKLIKKTAVRTELTVETYTTRAETFEFDLKLFNIFNTKFFTLIMVIR